jgi:hypothetical protein
MWRPVTATVVADFSLPPKKRAVGSSGRSFFLTQPYSREGFGPSLCLKTDSRCGTPVPSALLRFILKVCPMQNTKR